MVQRAPAGARPPASPRSVTIRDVAERAGVSIGTVSRAFKGQGGLTETTRQSVLRVASDLGYDTTKLRAAKLRRVTFLVRRQHSALSANPFYSHVLHGVEDACRARGLTLHYSSLGPDENAAEVLRGHAAGALLCVGYFKPALMEQLLALELPLVLVDHFAPDLPGVNSDNLGGAYAATRHLLASGRRRVAFVGGPDHHSIRERHLGYRRALYDAGVPADPALDVRRDPLDEEEGATGAMRTLLALPEPPDAVFAFNDATALLAMRTCQAAGLRVPQDIAFVGFDDLDAAAEAHPPLSSVRVDKEALGRRGVELLLERRPMRAGNVTVPVELVVRASSRASGAGKPRR